ncbi:hypothetical protein CPB83DRAFT_833595 [Crepidotus variabilis]|uniref:Uncharacterized protein n=1 Tax=Crepidotus variabilis TaxID=179855 RepID=A0A9P6JSM2_9AGAR|nr:hypothetical protein CPB83DRAFT_833595 [Crepidotus variabilis]
MSVLQRNLQIFSERSSKIDPPIDCQGHSGPFNKRRFELGSNMNHKAQYFLPRVYAKLALVWLPFATTSDDLDVDFATLTMEFYEKIFFSYAIIARTGVRRRLADVFLQNPTLYKISVTSLADAYLTRKITVVTLISIKICQQLACEGAGYYCPTLKRPTPFLLPLSWMFATLHSDLVPWPNGIWVLVTEWSMQGRLTVADNPS